MKNQLTLSQSPAVSLLLACLRRRDAQDLKPGLGELTPDQWQELTTAARQLGLAGVLYQRLADLQLSPPSEITEQLRQNFLWTFARNLRFNKELTSLVERLASESIPVILLKGAYLAEHVYANPGLRSMSDIDLLVPREDVEKAIAAAEFAGFEAPRTFFPEADGLLHYHAPPMNKNGLLIELHWSLTRESNLATIDVAGLWVRARRIKIDGVDALTLCPNDLVLHLAVHAAYGHRFHLQLRSLYDLEVVLQKFSQELDWGDILEVCRLWKAERGTYLVLRLVIELFGSNVPAEVLTALQPEDFSEDVLDYARQSLTQSTPMLSENYIRLMHSPRLGDKLAGLFNGLFPKREVIAMEFDVPPASWRIWLLYPVHALRSIQKYWWRAWGLLLGDRVQTRQSLTQQTLKDWLRVR